MAHDVTALEQPIPVEDLPLLDRIRSLVLGGEFPPGAPLSEIFLSNTFEVSRTPVREALKQLQHEGLVEIRPKVGTFVREPSRREIVELFQLKESLEGLAAGLLAQRGDSRSIDLLDLNVSSSMAALSENDSRGYAQLVHEFHWTIIRGADNHKLAEHYERLMNQLAYHRLVLQTIERPGRMAASTNEHAAVVQMIKSKDPFGAESAMRSHVLASSREVLT